MSKLLRNFGLLLIPFLFIGCLSLDYLTGETPAEEEVVKEEPVVEPPLGDITLYFIDANSGETITRQVMLKFGDKTPVHFSLGKYSFRNLPKGNHSVKASANGYLDYSGTVRVIGGSHESVYIEMIYKH